MSKAKLKKALLSMDRAEITGMILELYDARKDAREYLDYWLDPDPAKALLLYKESLRRLYFLPSGMARKSVPASTVNDFVKKFASMCCDPELQAELMLYLCDTDFEWIRAREWRALSHIPVLQRTISRTRQLIDNTDANPGRLLRLDRLEEALGYFADNPPQRRRRGWRW